LAYFSEISGDTDERKTVSSLPMMIKPRTPWYPVMRWRAASISACREEDSAGGREEEERRGDEEKRGFSQFPPLERTQGFKAKIISR